MSTPAEALHAIRNDLTPIFFCAELALEGDRDAQNLCIRELARHADSIQEELDILSTAIRAAPAGHI